MEIAKKLIIIALIFLGSCKTEMKRSTSEIVTTKQTKQDTANLSSVSYNNELLQNWDNAHNIKDMEKLKSFYAPSVFYYTKSISVDELIKRKIAALQKQPDYSQKSSFIDSHIYNDRKEILFDKTYLTNGKKATIRSILTLVKTDQQKDGFKIIEESDLPSKKYLKKLDKEISSETDFNGDGKKEYAEIISPKIIENEFECEGGECITKIQFSDASIPTIEVKGCIGGMLEIEGDLDNDGNIEIGIVDDWFTSRWGRYIVYTLKNNTWEVFISLTIDRFTVMDDAKLRTSLVRKVSNAEIEVSNFVWNEDADMVVKKSIVKTK